MSKGFYANLSRGVIELVLLILHQHICVNINTIMENLNGKALGMLNFLHVKRS